MDNNNNNNKKKYLCKIEKNFLTIYFGKVFLSQESDRYGTF